MGRGREGREGREGRGGKVCSALELLAMLTFHRLRPWARLHRSDTATQGGVLVVGVLVSVSGWVG